MTLSVIVPVYNAVSSLARCLDSLIQQWPQERSDYEVICVNDGSKDQSGEILKSYKVKYPHIIKIVEQANQGLPAARNAGMSIATGEIIAFCDADDYLFPGGYYFLYGQFWNKSIEILRFSSVTLDQYVMKSWKEPESLTQNVLYEGTGIDCLVRRNILPFVWSNFYRRTFLISNHITTSSVVMCEDMVFNLDAYIQASHVKIVDTCIYRYTVSDNQITKKRDRLTMSRAVDGYLQFFNRIHHYNEIYPSAKEALNHINQQQLLPFFSRALCARLEKNEFLSLKHQLVTLEIFPLSPVSFSHRLTNAIVNSYLWFRVVSLFYSKLFIPYLLPHLPRN